jgi:signal transduction histidine kinase
MPTTLGKRRRADIVPESGFRPPTTVGVQVRPKQDVCDADPFYDEPMLRTTERAREWLLEYSRLIPEQYSWLFVVSMQSAMALILIGSAFQRTRADLPAVAVAALIAVAQLVICLLIGTQYIPALVGLTWWTAAAILLFGTSTPVRTDSAPLLLVLMMGCVASLARPWWGVLAFASAVTLLVAASVTHRLDGAALYLGFVAIGWLAGHQMRTQHQLLLRQQQLQADLTEHAAADERRRIAREVHDVIAHSLSVTLLHVTGARHALQQDRDVEDAVGALLDAERLGRQAMADIRSTVGLLDDGRARTAPEPGITDIPDLIDDFVQAGLPISLHIDGEPDQVSAAVGLALYRITQESLANIAKHAAASKAQVDLTISSSVVVLSVVNDLPVRAPDAPAACDGRGLPGMRQRVELLGGVLDAGRSPQCWSVRAEIPLTDAQQCPLR